MTMITNANPNDQLQQLDNDPTPVLSVQDLAIRLGESYGRIRGYTEISDVSALLGGRRVPGLKGLRYPASAEELLRSLLEAANEGLVQPKQAAAWLARVERSASTTISGTATDAPIAPLHRLSDSSPAVERVTGLLEEIVSLLQKDNAQDGRDRLVTAREAGEILARSPRSVARYVAPAQDAGRLEGRRWRHSDLQRFIEEL